MHVKIMVIFLGMHNKNKDTLVTSRISPAVKKGAAPTVKKDVKSKVMAKKWL